MENPFGEGKQPIELSEREFYEQVNAARDILSQTYADSRPLLMLGYNANQIRILHNNFGLVAQGDAVDAKWNDAEFSFYRHYASFQGEQGSVSLNFSGNKDFQAIGRVTDELLLREGFKGGMHPHLFLLRQQEGQSLSLKDVGQRIFRGEFTGEQTLAKKVLSKIPLTKEMPIVKDSYQTQWLDDDTRMDAVFYFPSDEKYIVFRKVVDKDGYETWGVRQNVNTSEIKQALESKAKQTSLSFQLGNARTN